jgi:hypothetical protein
VQLIPQGLSTWVWTDGSFTRLSNPPGWQEINTYVVSAAASQTVLLPGPFRRWRLTLQKITATLASGLLLTGSNNSGSSFASGYTYAIGTLVVGSTTAGLASAQGAPSIIISPGLNTTGNSYDATLEIAPQIGGFYVRGNSFSVSSSPIFVADLIFGSGPVTGLNAVAITSTSGTFSGQIIVEGLP